MDDLFGISEFTILSRVYRLRARYPGRITAVELRAVIGRSEGKCCWCGKGVRGSDLTIEHFAPTNDPASLGVACFSCNSAHKTGHKKRSDLSSDLLKHRADKGSRTWEKENAELQRALRRAQYIRHKDGYIKRYKEANRERLAADRKRYYQEHRAALLAKRKQWELENKESFAAQRKEWRKANPDVVKQRWAQYAAGHREELNVKARQHQREKLADPDKRDTRNAQKRAWYEANKERILAKATETADARNARRRAQRAALKAAAASATGSLF